MLDDVKRLLGIEDDQKDALLETIIVLTESKLINLLGGVGSVPDELQYIVTEVAIKRFNRIGSEGMSAQTVEGQSLTFEDDDFSEFKDDISAYAARNSSVKASYGVNFL